MLLLGLILFGFGIGLQVRADLGLAPWEAMHQGMSLHTPLSIGIAGILMGVLVLVLWIPLRQRPGIGTITNVIVIGLVIDLTLLIMDDITTTALRWLFMLGGIVMIGVGSGIYIGTRLGPGPRDGLMTGLAERGISIRVARFGIEGAVLLVGWLLGGTIGIGTIAFTVLIGPLVQFFSNASTRVISIRSGAKTRHRPSDTRSGVEAEAEVILGGDVICGRRFNHDGGAVVPHLEDHGHPEELLGVGSCSGGVHLDRVAIDIAVLAQPDIDRELGHVEFAQVILEHRSLIVAELRGESFDIEHGSIVRRHNPAYFVLTQVLDLGVGVGQGFEQLGRAVAVRAEPEA